MIRFILATGLIVLWQYKNIAFWSRILFEWSKIKLKNHLLPEAQIVGSEVLAVSYIHRGCEYTVYLPFSESTRTSYLLKRADNSEMKIVQEPGVPLLVDAAMFEEDAELEKIGFGGPKFLE